jgi:3-oxoadipate enol-lactonase
MPIVKVNDIEIYYEIHEATQGESDGEVRRSRTPLLLITGLGLNTGCWQKNLTRLTRERTVIIFDNRGAGRSSKPDMPYSVAMMADDTAAFMEAIGIRRAHVFGFSLGSLVAQELALRHTHRVKGLILGASTAGGFHHEIPKADVLEVMLERSWVNPIINVEMAIPLIYSPMFIMMHPDQIMADSLARLAYPTPPYAFRHQMVAATQHNTYDRLDQLPMPTLVLHGTADMLVGFENAKRMARRIPHAELKEISGAGHFFTSEQPELTSRLILEFLRTHFSHH